MHVNRLLVTMAAIGSGGSFENKCAEARVGKTRRSKGLDSQTNRVRAYDCQSEVGKYSSADYLFRNLLT